MRRRDACSSRRGRARSGRRRPGRGGSTSPRSRCRGRSEARGSAPGRKRARQTAPAIPARTNARLLAVPGAGLPAIVRRRISAAARAQLRLKRQRAGPRVEVAVLVAHRRAPLLIPARQASGREDEKSGGDVASAPIRPHVPERPGNGRHKPRCEQDAEREDEEAAYVAPRSPAARRGRAGADGACA